MRTFAHDVAVVADDVLQKLRGDDIGRAARSLPPCSSESPATVETVIEVDGFGRVRFTFRRIDQRRRISRSFWTPELAERVK